MTADFGYRPNASIGKRAKLFLAQKPLQFVGKCRFSWFVGGFWGMRRLPQGRSGRVSPAPKIVYFAIGGVVGPLPATGGCLGTSVKLIGLSYLLSAPDAESIAQPITPPSTMFPKVAPAAPDLSR